MKVIKWISVLLTSVGLVACDSTADTEKAVAPVVEKGNVVEIVIKNNDIFAPEKSSVIIYQQRLGESGLDTVASGPWQQGKFTYSGKADNGWATVDVLSAEGGVLSRQKLVMEPGAVVTVSFSDTRNVVFSGGRYNKLLSELRNSSEMKVLNEALRQRPENIEFSYHLKQVFVKKRAFTEKYVGDMNDNHLKALLYADSDLYPFDSPEERLAVVEELVDVLGKDHYQAQVILANTRRTVESRRQARSVVVGKVIKDFQAENLAGEAFQLADVMKQNKYVLVEFWASWCGPCRAEIPHMKQAYKHYNDKSFEIVSFTLDDDRDAWQEASDEEQIPWIDVSDLQAYNSPVAQMYGVQGVPANYLVEASSGKILAIHLRGEALDNKLAELLD